MGTNSERSNYGFQSKQKNKRLNNQRTATAHDNNPKNINSRGQFSSGTYKLQRSYSSQNSQFKGSSEDMANNGKKLYSKVACKASDLNTKTITSATNKPQGSSKRENIVP